MSGRRVIVPDTSVLVAAHFPEKTFPAADRLVDAIERNRVTAFVPEIATAEFLKTASEKCSTRVRDRVSREEATAQVHRFFELSLTLVGLVHLRELAWEIMQEDPIGPPDSWFVACAMQREAELWVTHEHRDGFVAAARKRVQVFTLEQDSKLLPKGQ